MIGESLGLILDVVVLVLLGVMIFYALRLSNSLNNFRSHREEFDQVVRELLSTIEKADRSVQNLKKASMDSADDLEDLIRKSKGIIVELKDIHELSEGMANRLEGLAEKNRRVVMDDDRRVPPVSAPAPAQESFESSLRHVPAKPEKKAEIRREPDLPSFMIRDPDYGDMDALEGRLGHAVSNDGFDDDDVRVPEKLQSQAERELFQALRKTKKTLGEGRG